MFLNLIFTVWDGGLIVDDDNVLINKEDVEEENTVLEAVLEVDDLEEEEAEADGIVLEVDDLEEEEAEADGIVLEAEDFEVECDVEVDKDLLDSEDIELLTTDSETEKN